MVTVTFGPAGRPCAAAPVASRAVAAGQRASAADMVFCIGCLSCCRIVCKRDWFRSMRGELRILEVGDQHVARRMGDARNWASSPRSPPAASRRTPRTPAARRRGRRPGRRSRAGRGRRCRSGCGRPIWTGAPCTAGKRVVICTARIASAGLNGRIDTTSGPRNGPAGVVSIEVRYIGTLRRCVDVAQSSPSATQRLLERERAADHEADEVVAPVRLDVVRLLDQLAVAPDAVARQVGADVEVGAERRHARVAGLGHAEQRARLRIALAEAQEVVGEVGGQDGEVALDIAGCAPAVGRRCSPRRTRSRAARPVSAGPTAPSMRLLPGSATRQFTHAGAALSNFQIVWRSIRKIYQPGAHASARPCCIKSGARAAAYAAGVIQPTPAPPGSVRIAIRPTSAMSKSGRMSFAPEAVACPDARVDIVDGEVRHPSLRHAGEFGGR